MYYILNRNKQFMYRGTWSKSRRQAYRTWKGARQALARYTRRYGHCAGGTWMEGAEVVSHFDPRATW